MLKSFLRPCYATEGGGASPSPAAQTGAEPGTQTGATTTGSTPAAASGDTDEKVHTKADVERIVKERLADEKRRSEARQTEAQRKAEADALAKNGEWEKVAAQQATQLQTLQVQVDLAIDLTKQLNAMIDAQIKDWPGEVKQTDPGVKDPRARGEWMEKMLPLAQKLASVPSAPSTETGKRTTPAATTAPANTTQQTSRYRFQQDGDIGW